MRTFFSVVREFPTRYPFEITMTWTPEGQLEMWKGDQEECAYPNWYLGQKDRVIAHTHPGEGNMPPSGRDLINSGDAIEGQEHWVLTAQGVWRYHPAPALLETVRSVTTERNRWEQVILHNAARLGLAPTTDCYKGLIPLQSGARVGWEVSFHSWETENEGQWPRLVHIDTFTSQLQGIDKWPIHGLGFTTSLQSAR